MNLIVNIPSKADVETMARTILGEARGEGWDGMVAVGNVIKNRAKIGGWWGNTIKDVCLKPKQFSCWNNDDPNKTLIINADLSSSLAFQQAFAAACYVVYDMGVDTTNGATHYHTKAIHPAWAKGVKPVADKGNHLFYKDIK